MRKHGPLSGGVLIAAVLCLAPVAEAQHRGPFLVRSGSKCLDVNGPQAKTNGGRVQIWDCNGGPNQVWRHDRGRVISQASGRCLDVNGPDLGLNGARIQVWDCNNSPNQAWRFDGGRLLAQDGRCLDVHGPDMNQNGGHVQTWDCNGGPNQAFSVERIGGPPPPPPGMMVPPPAPVVMVPPPAPVVMMPPPGPGPRPIGDRRMADLLGAMRAESFSQGKIRVLEDVAGSQFFLIAQLRQIIENLTFSADKIRAVEIIAPRVLDRGNAYRLYTVFTFDSEKEQAREIFKRNP